MLSQIELTGNVTIGQAFRHHLRYLPLPFCQQVGPVGTFDRLRFARSQSFSNKTQLVASNPDLSLAYHANTFAQHLKRFVPREHPIGTRPEPLYNQVALRRIDQQDDTDMRATLPR